MLGNSIGSFEKGEDDDGGDQPTEIGDEPNSRGVHTKYIERGRVR